MRFLIDRCAGNRLADWLPEAGHDVVESREHGSESCGTPKPYHSWVLRTAEKHLLHAMLPAVSR